MIVFKRGISNLTDSRPELSHTINPLTCKATNLGTAYLIT